MKALGLFLLALCAIAFLRGVASPADPTRGDPTPAQAAAEAMRAYAVDTPADLARMERENAEHLRTLCREGFVDRGYCHALDKAE